MPFTGFGPEHAAGLVAVAHRVAGAVRRMLEHVRKPGPSRSEDAEATESAES